MATTKSKANKRKGVPRELKDKKAYTVGVELPDGKKLIATPTGLREIKTTISELVFDDKKQAQSSANKIAAQYKQYKGVAVKPYVGRLWQGGEDNKPDENLIKDKPITQCSQKSRSKTGAKKTGETAAQSTGANAQSRQAAPTAPKSSPSFTVMAGRKSKTFATKKEAKAYEKAVRGRTGKQHKIRESTRKPTHKLVSFTAKK